MKKTLIVLLAAAVAAGCTTNKYNIKGNDESFAEMSYVLLQTIENGERNTIDSVAIVDNSFAFKGEATTPSIAYLFFGAEAPEDPTKAMPMMFSVPVYLEAGNITVGKSSPEDPTPVAKGTPLNDKQAEFNGKVVALSKEFQAAAQSGDEQKMSDLQGQFNTMMKETMEANTDNLFGVSMLQQIQYNLEPQEIIDAVAKFPAEFQEQLAGIKTQAENALKTQPGQPYIDIVQKDADGKEISLKSVVETKGNKYVLIDFWASWCGPCMGEVPFLVDTYAKYHDKGFEIYGVSFDSDRDAWLGAVEGKKMTWIHVSDVKGWDNQARNDYAVNGIPANYLVDCATGKIVATSLRGEALQAKIAELLD
ncbi:MAG: AhpC/TSA family protein [Alistipes sp.]|nr:AhpC/TSA family protein [Alistipes sp.]